VFHWTLFR